MRRTQKKIEKYFFAIDPLDLPVWIFSIFSIILREYIYYGQEQHNTRKKKWPLNLAMRMS